MLSLPLDFSSINKDLPASNDIFQIGKAFSRLAQKDEDKMSSFLTLNLGLYTGISGLIWDEVGTHVNDDHD